MVHKVKNMKKILLLAISILSFSCTNLKKGKIEHAKSVISSQDYEQYNNVKRDLTDILIEDPFNKRYSREVTKLLAQMHSSKQSEYHRICVLYRQNNDLKDSNCVEYPWYSSEWLWWYPQNEINLLKVKLEQKLIEKDSFIKQEKTLIANARENFIKQNRNDLRLVDWDIFSQYRKKLKP